MNYQQFEKDFNEKFDAIYEFFEESPVPLNGQFEKDNSIYYNDSYGNSNDTLIKVYHFPDYNCFVQFEGTYASYEGETWNSMKEVSLVTKTIQVYE